MDPKGDLANLLLTFPNLSAAEFAPWVNQDEARAAGQTPEAYAASEAARWAAGLQEWGQDAARIARLQGRGRLRGLHAWQHHRPPDLDRGLVRGAAGRRCSTIPTCWAIASRRRPRSVLTLAGIDAEPLRSREHILLSTLFAERWRAGQDLDLPSLISLVQNPPVTKVGVMDLEVVLPVEGSLRAGHAAQSAAGRARIRGLAAGRSALDWTACSTRPKASRASR